MITDSPRSAEERAALYLEIQPLVRSLLARYSSDPEVFQDMPGEIYCRFHGLLDRYDRDRGIPVRAYLIRCLQAGIYSWVRSHWRRRKHEAEFNDRTGGDYPYQGGDFVEAMVETADRASLLRSVRGAVGSLPARQREVVIARYYKSASYEEISQSMEIGQATARSLVRHGLSKIRRRVAPDESRG